SSSVFVALTPATVGASFVPVMVIVAVVGVVDSTLPSSPWLAWSTAHCLRRRIPQRRSCT
ncbi:hypothetical protein KW438_22545, partial [Vibrio fluvialis]|nr:hypothetical protein [Vibrio fluvialis]